MERHRGWTGSARTRFCERPGEFSAQLGLNDLVSPLRLRGMAAMQARIKRQVREQQN